MDKSDVKHPKSLVEIFFFDSLNVYLFFHPGDRPSFTKKCRPYFKKDTDTDQ